VNAHTPAVAQLASGAWGVYCTACSADEGNYVYPCKLRTAKTIWPPAELVAANVDEMALLDVLEDVIWQACSDEAGVIDSMATSAYAEGIHVLVEHGRLRVVREHGRRVIAVSTSTPTKAAT
jgi:hypothetical protein